jgi:glycine hydroxymethyltransferase
VLTDLNELHQTIAAVATALLQVIHPSFRVYAKQVIANARALASGLMEYGYKLQTGGTDNHLVLWDLRPLGLTGSKVEKLCDLMGITINSLYIPSYLMSTCHLMSFSSRKRRFW